MRPVLPLPLMPWLLVLGSCSSPPKPPTVEESSRRPANSVMAIELQVCSNNLHNARLSATESGRLVESLATTAAQLAARQQALALPQVPPANSVYSIRFEFGSARVLVPADTAAALIEDARAAPLVLLRGRTDGTVDSAAESRIARERAAAMRDYLVAAGVDAARIRATFQPAGDHAADNSNPFGRSMNRRVEIEVYRAVPVALRSQAAEMR